MRQKQHLVTLHAKFSRLLVRGKARFNFLRAARWRNEAAKRLDDLVEEERRLAPPRAILDEPVVAVRRNARSVIPKFRRRAKPQPPKLIEKPFVKPTKYEPTAVEEPVEAPPEPPSAPVERAARQSFAVRFPRVKVEPTPPPKRSRSDSIMRFKSHGTGGDLGPRVSVAFGRTCRVDGACLVSSRGVVFDERLEGWRFLIPGSCVRCEFRVDDSSDLRLELADFVTPDAPPTAVDISLDGALVTANHAPRAGLAVFALHGVTTTKRHVLDIMLREDAAPWAYHLEALSISRKTRRRQPPSRREIARLLASIPPNTGAEATTDTTAEHHRLLLDTYERGHRNYEREKKRRLKEAP